MKTFFAFLLFVASVLGADPISLQPKVGTTTVIAATNGYAGTMNVKTQLNVGFGGVPGTLSVSNGLTRTFLVDGSSNTVTSVGNLIIPNVGTGKIVQTDGSSALVPLLVGANLTYDGQTLAAVSSAGTNSVYVQGVGVVNANFAVNSNVIFQASSSNVTAIVTNVSNTQLLNSSVTVTGTADQVNVSGSPVSLGGTVTLSTPQSIATTSSPTFAAETITGNVTAGGNAAITGSLGVTGTITNSALQPAELVYATATKVLGSISPGNSGDVLISSGAGVAPAFGPAFGGTVGTVKNTGTSAVGSVPTYSDTTGTNIAPSAALTITGTNAALVGNLTGNGAAFTNTLTLGGTSVATVNAASLTTGTLDNARLSAVPNSALANSSLTINGTVVSLGGARTLNLASADYANQGTTSTLLHGNASGNPSFGAVNLASEVTGTLSGGSVGSGIDAGNITAGTLPNARLSAVPNSALANSSVTVAGTANRVTVSGSPVSLGGTVTLSGPQDIHTGASPTFAGLSITGLAKLDSLMVTNKVTIGSGDSPNVFGLLTTGQALDIRIGTAAAPDTNTNGPPLKAARTMALSNSSLAGSDGAELAAAIQGIGYGVASNGVQVVGVYGAAVSASTNTTTAGADDACGLYGEARILAGAGTALNFLGVRKDVSTARACGLEISVRNQTTTPDAYNPTGFQNSQGFWLHATGLTNVGTGLTFCNPFGPRFDVGIGFLSETIGVNTGAVINADIRTDDDSVTPFVINGHHTDGIDTSGSTLSGLPLRVAAGQKAGQFDHLAPTTARGDIITRGASANGALAVGAAGAALVSDGTDPLWSEPQNSVVLYDENLLNGSGQFKWTPTGTLTTVASTGSHQGIVRIPTGTATNDIAGNRVSTTSTLFGSGRTIFKTGVRVPTLSDGTDTFTVFVGFDDVGNAVGDAVDGVYFVYSSSTTYYITNTSVGKWVGHTANNSVRSETAPSASVVGNQFYTLAIDVNAAGSQADFYIDGVLLGSLTTNIPTSAGRETGLCLKKKKKKGTNARQLDDDFDWFYFRPTSLR